jgi:hypothetical protein
MNELTGKLKDLYHEKMHDMEKMKKEAKKEKEKEKSTSLLSKVVRYTLLYFGVKKLVKTLA